VHPVEEAVVQWMPAGSLSTVPALALAPTRYTVSEGRLDVPPPGFTLRLEVPIITELLGPSGELAVMFVTQGAGGVQAIAVASPDESIAAMSTSLDAQVTVSVRSTVVGLVLKVPSAMNCEVSPILFKVCVSLPGRIVMADSARAPPPPPATTIRLAVPVTTPLNECVVAVIGVVPVPVAVTSPEESTVATRSLADAHVTCVVRSCVFVGCPLS
jgi:hypothetical protein